MIEHSTDTSILQKMQIEYLTHYPNEAATSLESLSPDDVVKVIIGLPLVAILPSIIKLSDDMLIEVCKKIEFDYSRKIISELPVEKIHRILSGLDTKIKKPILQSLPASKRMEINELEKYPPGSAGSLMDTNIIQFRPDMSVSEAIQKIKARKKRGIRLIFVSDENKKLHSMASTQQLIMAEENQTLSEITRPIPAFVNDIDRQDEIVKKLEEFKLTDIPVIDIHRRFVGVVQHHTLIKATREELTRDIQKMVGVSKDERALSKVLFSVKKRLPWLQINLLTAFLAAAVVGIFESTIAKYTALAVLLPVVAGQSGNTGAQALAVTMRGLALKEIRTSHWLKLIFKELRVSLITGIAVGLTTAAGVLVWSKSLGLTLIIGVSMVISMMLASISGAAVPLILSKLGQDPAASSSILLTTVTDICGFFSFLGIATLLSGII